LAIGITARLLQRVAGGSRAGATGELNIKILFVENSTAAKAAKGAADMLVVQRTVPAGDKRQEDAGKGLAPATSGQ
jgi:hypothetical protein